MISLFNRVSPHPQDIITVKKMNSEEYGREDPMDNVAKEIKALGPHVRTEFNQVLHNSFILIMSI
jgi:hypothetical protein